MKHWVIELPNRSEHSDAWVQHCPAWPEGQAGDAPWTGERAESVQGPGEATLVLPASALSWHRVTLPPGLERQSAQRQAALRHLLEDSLLDDPAQLHLALAPGWRAGQACWVAACDRNWLQAWIDRLQAQGWRIRAIVPQLAPQSPAPQAVALGGRDQGQLYLESAESGVQRLAGVGHFSADLSAWGSPPPTEFLSDAATARWLQETGLTPQRLISRQALLDPVLAQGWNLAQGDLQTGPQGLPQRLGQGLREWALAPAWRSLRWSLLALLLVQLVGLQAWAWRTRAQWSAEEEQWAKLLRETFPAVSTVVDAPAQMRREVDRLRQQSGQLGPDDLETQLSALAQALPESMPRLQSLRFQNGQLELGGLSLPVAQQAALPKALQSLGQQARLEGSTLTLQALPESAR